MKIRRKISKYNQESRNGADIKYIVIHFIGGISTAKNNVDYFAGGNRNAGAHYFVDNEIWQSVTDDMAAWHCGATAPYNQNIGGASYWGKCNNHNSIGIEMCLSEYKGRMYVTAETMRNTKDLVKYLMKKYNIPYSRVIRHFDVTGKMCPACWTHITVKHPLVHKNLINKGRWLSFRHYITDVYRYETKKGTPVRAGKRGKIIKRLKKGSKITFTRFDGNWGVTASKHWVYMGNVKRV